MTLDKTDNPIASLIYERLSDQTWYVGQTNGCLHDANNRESLGLLVADSESLIDPDISVFYTESAGILYFVKKMQRFNMKQ